MAYFGCLSKTNQPSSLVQFSNVVLYLLIKKAVICHHNRIGKKSI